MTRKKWIALLAVLLCAVTLYWRPMNLGQAVAAEESNFAVTSNLHRITNGNIDNLVLSYDLPAGSPEVAAMAEILEKYSYHRCLRTPFSDGSMDGKGGSDYTIILSTTKEHIICSGTGEILVGSRLYRTDYIGQRNGMKLVEEITALLAACEPRE